MYAEDNSRRLKEVVWVTEEKKVETFLDLFQLYFVDERSRHLHLPRNMLYNSKIAATTDVSEQYFFK